MNESSPRSDSISIIYNGYDCSSAVKNSLVPLQQLTCILLMQTSTNTSSWPIYTGINQHKTIPSIWTFILKANHAQSKSAHVPHPNLHFLLGSIRETCFDASCPLTHILFSSKPGNLHSTLTWHLRDCDLWLWPRTLTGCCPVSGSVLSWFSLFATWDSGSLCQPVLGCVCFGCSAFVRGGLLRVVVPVEFFSSPLGLTTRLPPNIESRSSARDCKISHRLHICKPLVQSRTSARDCKILHRPHICKPHDIRSSDPSARD